MKIELRTFFSRRRVINNTECLLILRVSPFFFVYHYFLKYLFPEHEVMSEKKNKNAFIIKINKKTLFFILHPSARLPPYQFEY